jgi:hypothetical protein
VVRITSTLIISNFQAQESVFQTQFQSFLAMERRALEAEAKVASLTQELAAAPKLVVLTKKRRFGQYKSSTRFTILDQIFRASTEFFNQ